MLLPFGRYQLITSVISVISIVVLMLLYRGLSTSDLIEQETRSNVEMTRIFQNSIWPNYRTFIMNASELPIQTLTTRPEIDNIHQDVLKMMSGSNIVKCKNLQHQWTSCLFER